MLDLPGLDAVVIATTPNMHYAQAKTALERGKHVLIEKPMTFTAAEAKELCDLAEAQGVQLLISCPWHFTPHGIEVREMIRRGDLGEIRMISLLMTNPIDKLLTGSTPRRRTGRRTSISSRATVPTTIRPSRAEARSIARFPTPRLT